MKRWAPVALAAAVLVVAAPLLVIADSGDSRLERQIFRSKMRASQTASTNWVDLPGLSKDAGISVCAQHSSEVSATFSFVAAGGPAAFRLVTDGVPENPMDPGKISVTPNGLNSYSFTFAANVFDFEDNSNHHIAVQWKSRNGEETIVRRALLNVAFEQAAAEQCAGG